MNNIIKIAEEQLTSCISKIDQFNVKEFFKHRKSSKCCGKNFEDAEDDVELGEEIMENALSEASLALAKENPELHNRGAGGLITLKTNRLGAMQVEGFSDAVQAIRSELSNSLGGNWVVSGLHYYPQYAYMGWHTNARYPGKRFYLTYAEEGDKSFLRYEENGEIITDMDKYGWQTREFDIPEENYYWHCVGSRTKRYSLGFRQLTSSDRAFAGGIEE